MTFRARPSRWRSDLGWVAAAALVCYALSAALELRESIDHWLARYEAWQADELPLALTVLAGGLVWYAWRRLKETQVELRLRAEAEARVTDLLAHNHQLAQRLIAVQENERRALARELHDEFGQSCSAIRAETAYLRNCAADDRAGMLAAAARADAAARQLYQLVRDMLGRLRPSDLDTLGLLAALQAMCEAWEERSQVPCVFHHEGMGDSLSEPLGDAVDITVYRVVQEALTNAQRHARASRVRVVLARSAPRQLELSIEDDGQGMDPAAATQGLGLLGAGERAAALGAELQVRSTPGSGVRLTLRIALPAAPARAGDPA